jgi:hypothetical protein
MSKVENPLDRAFKEELERRLKEIDARASEGRGEFGPFDWILTVLLFLLLPLLMVWFFR